jgi:hypothetical protein
MSSAASQVAGMSRRKQFHCATTIANVAST